MVAANHGLTGMSKEHLGIALALHVPIMVVVTKIDSCPAHVLEDTMKQITRILRSPGARKVPIMMRTRADCVTTATHFGPRLCPIFQVSNVTGQNLDLVRLFLNLAPHHGRYDAAAPLEMRVNDTFSVPFVGTVVSGVVKAGVVHEGDDVLIGPDPLGRFAQTVVRSIERKRLRVPAASAGQSVSFALKKIKRKDVRRGMVLVRGAASPEGSTTGAGGASHAASSAAASVLHPPRVEMEFVAEVLILSHATTIKTNYQAMLHVGPVAQTCAIVAMDRELIRTGDRATVVFKFLMRPEYVQPGDRILFRDGRTKGLGIVKEIGYKGPRPLMEGGA
jgi:GTPase